MTKPTYAIRRYAAEIYRLQENQPYVGLSDLAEEVGASLQATSRMIGRLKESGYVEHEPYRGVRLTPAGETVALPAIRRHRLVENFLVRVLKYGWDEVHDHSERFEPGIDDLLEERIDELMGHPYPLPARGTHPNPGGVMPVLSDASLVGLPAEAAYRLSRVRLHDVAKLRYLGELGLMPGAQLQLVSIAPFHGPVRIRFHRQEIVLSYELAAALFVDPV